MMLTVRNLSSRGEREREKRGGGEREKRRAAPPPAYSCTIISPVLQISCPPYRIPYTRVSYTMFPYTRVPISCPIYSCPQLVFQFRVPYSCPQLVFPFRVPILVFPYSCIISCPILGSHVSYPPCPNLLSIAARYNINSAQHQLTRVRIRTRLNEQRAKQKRRQGRVCLPRPLLSTINPRG